MQILVLLAVVGAVAWFVWRSQNTQFVVAVNDGQVEVRSGDVPPSFLATVRDLARADPGLRCTITAFRDTDGVRLEARGLDDGRTQRLRNTLRLSPQSRLRGTENPVNEHNARRAYGLASWIRALFRR